MAGASGVGDQGKVLHQRSIEPATTGPKKDVTIPKFLEFEGYINGFAVLNRGEDQGKMIEAAVMQANAVEGLVGKLCTHLEAMGGTPKLLPEFKAKDSNTPEGVVQRKDHALKNLAAVAKQLDEVVKASTGEDEATETNKIWATELGVETKLMQTMASVSPAMAPDEALQAMVKMGKDLAKVDINNPGAIKKVLNSGMEALKPFAPKPQANLSLGPVHKNDIGVG